MQYLALLYGDEEAAKNDTPEQQQAEIAAYFVFNDHARSQGALRGGEALMPSTTAKSVRVRDGETLVTEGPFAETREVLGGFYLLECETEEQAIELASRIPAAQNGTVEIRPIMLIPGDG